MSSLSFPYPCLVEAAAHPLGAAVAFESSVPSITFSRQTDHRWRRSG